MVATIIVIAVIAILVLWIISVQRTLVSHDEFCKNAMSQIGVQQESRWDALSSLADLVKSYNEHEYKTLIDVITARKQITGASSASDVEGQDQAITGALKQINVVAEQYPELKANENYARLMDSLNTYENQVRTSRMVYNDTVTKYNNLIRQFPGSVIAGLLKFTSREYLNVPAGKTEMPSMKI